MGVGENIQKMVDSANTKEVRKEILTSGITRYYRLVLKDVVGSKSLYRSDKNMKDCRDLKPLKARA